MIPFLKVALSNLFKKPSTVPYPSVPSEAAEKYRGRISYDGDKCVNCGMCYKVCSPGAISTTSVDTGDGKDITYRFDLTSCTFCGMCQDFCTEKAICLTKDYHMVSSDPEKDLIVTGVCHKDNPKGKLVCNESCVLCAMCATKCPEGAITFDEETHTRKVDETKCIKCGTCVVNCPNSAVHFDDPQVHCLDEACVYCTLCAKKCPQGAITVDRVNKTWSIDKSKCVLCGKCIASCPKKALRF